MSAPECTCAIVWDAIKQAEVIRKCALCRAAAQMYAAAYELANRPHVLQVGKEGWGLEHTLACRVNLENLNDCAFNIAAAGITKPPAQVGRYYVQLDGHYGLIIGLPAGPDPAIALWNALGAARGETERVR